jgi:RNA polymerase sigma factor (sigma-70 family)
MHLLATDEAIESLYEEFVPMLVRIGTQQRGLAHGDAEAVAHDVFLDFLTKMDRVENYGAFLAGAMHNASRYFHRKNRTAESEPAPELSCDTTEALSNQLIASEALGTLTPRCQGALRLRYLEGYTVPELATFLCTSVKYAEKVVRECLQQARRRYVEKKR